jgi:hypothetical protein
MAITVNNPNIDPRDVAISVQTLGNTHVDTSSLGVLQVTFGDLQEVWFAQLAVQGYLCVCSSVSGNIATFYIYQDDASLTADGPLAAVASGANLGATAGSIAVGFGRR